MAKVATKQERKQMVSQILSWLENLTVYDLATISKYAQKIAKS